MSRKTVVEKVWEAHGLPCVVVLTEMGHRCGYVGVGEEHPLYNVDYNKGSPTLVERMKKLANKEVDIDKVGAINILCAGKDYMENPTPVLCLHVHGGLTFSGDGGGKYPVKVDTPTWWFGYDCAHLGDAREPWSEYSDIFGDGVVRTLEYCIGECESLAEQLSTVR